MDLKREIAFLTKCIEMEAERKKRADAEYEILRDAAYKKHTRDGYLQLSRHMTTMITVDENISELKLKIGMMNLEL